MSLAVRALRASRAWRQTPALRPLDSRIAPVTSLHDSLRHVSSTSYNRRKPSAIAQRLPDPERQPQRFRDFDLEGKVFIVTGGGRGLGLTLADVLVEAGGKGRSPLIPTRNFKLTS
jgi:hypothetical protein